MYINIIRKLSGLILGALIFLFLLGCKSNLTRVVVNEVGANNAALFQYYVSKTVVLERVANQSGIAAKTGTVRVMTKKIRDKIIITTCTPGVLDSWEIVGESLTISFEEGDSIFFHLDDRTKNFVLDPGEINYGGEIYKITFSQKKVRPFLKVRMLRQKINENNSRFVKGRKVK